MLLRVQEDASPLCFPSKTTYWREGPPARYAKRRHTTQDPEQDADDQDDRRLNTEAPAVDSASVPPTCCSGRQAERRHPTQDPEQTAPPHPEHLDEQDADEQGDGPPRARPRQDASAVDSVPMQYCSGCKQTLPLSDFPAKSNKILRNCVRCKVRLRLDSGPNPPTNMTPGEKWKSTSPEAASGDRPG
ncbi:hypothetical protein E4U45_002497 [Claviceps purpurea]|nr:hypothetical protein E4U45_002497 [Claviceps purpurea]